MNSELLEALNVLEKEKNISKDTLLEAIEQSLLQACKNHFGKADNVKVFIDPVTCEFNVHAEKTVVEKVEDPIMEISLENAKQLNSKYELGDIVNVEIKSKEFGRIATMNAKNVILQKIREEERKVLFEEYYQKEKDIITGIVQRYVGRNVSVNLGKVDTVLMENEMVKGEVFRPTERIKLYVLEVKDTPKGPKVVVSRTHPELVKRLFEDCGVEEEKLETFDNQYEAVAGEKATMVASNITNTRKFEIKTPDVVIHVEPEKVELVETRIIDGRKCLVIPMEDVEINGIRVRMGNDGNEKQEEDEEL